MRKSGYRAVSFAMAAWASFTGLAAQASAAGAAQDASKTPLSVFTWAGRGTGFSTNHNQGKLAGPKGGTDVDPYPTVDSIPKIGKADIAYVRNHGGVVETNPFFPGIQGGIQTKKFVDLGLPTEEDKGPSMVMAWGCQNGNPDYIEKYAKGFGVLKDSKTKLYIGPTFDVHPTESNFPTYFFVEFAKGNVTAREAARIAYDKWAAKWGTKAQAEKNFERDIGIWGNGDLTLNDVRRNVAARKSPPPPPPAPEKPTAPEPPKTGRPPKSFPPGVLVERQYWDAEKKVLMREYAYVLDGTRKVRNGLERRYFQDGKLEYEAVRKMDILEGPMVRYWANGQVFDVAQYVKGARDGAYEAFHDNGKTRAKGRYKRNRKVGAWTTWHRSGEKESEGTYLADYYETQRLPWAFRDEDDSNYGLHHELGWKSGEWIFYYPNGRKQKQETYGPEGEIYKKEGGLYGPRRSWYDNEANVMEEERLTNGAATRYYDNGQMAMRCAAGGSPCQSWDREGKEIRD